MFSNASARQWRLKTLHCYKELLKLMKPTSAESREKQITNPISSQQNEGVELTKLRLSVQSNGGGNVKARIADNLTGKGIVQFIKETVDTTSSLLITDEYKGYNALASLTPYRAVINHSVMYADGLTHTNTIEGFWSLLKRAWYGTHHNYAKQYVPLYIAEACWKYNHRKDQNGFGSFIHGCFK